MALSFTASLTSCQKPLWQCNLSSYKYLGSSIKADLTSAQHNASTPFLRLPLEIKYLIYNHAFGGNLIHIVNIAEVPHKGVAKFGNTICRAKISEEVAQKNFDEERKNAWNAPANEDRHECCRYRKSATDRDGEQQRPQTLNLGALRVCRQMYNEAHHVPYSANTFACTDSYTLQKFILSISKGSHNNHLAVRSLFLEMLYATLPNPKATACWRKALKTCVSKCKNVKNVNISLDLRCWYWMQGPRSPAALEANWQTPFMSDLFVLKRLPLKSATCVIHDAHICNGVSLLTSLINVMADPSRWTIEEKREWARYVRELILR